MMVPNDAMLLQEFATTGCEDAFTELVERHVGMVYSVALRRLNGNSGLAEDVAQQVFYALRKKKHLNSSGTVPAAWLHRATQHDL